MAHIATSKSLWKVQRLNGSLAPAKGALWRVYFSVYLYFHLSFDLYLYIYPFITQYLYLSQSFQTFSLTPPPLFLAIALSESIKCLSMYLLTLSLPHSFCALSTQHFLSLFLHLFLSVFLRPPSIPNPNQRGIPVVSERSRLGHQPRATL